MPQTASDIPVSERGVTWLWLSIAAALLAMAGSIVGLSVSSIYAPLTPAFLPQALAQDIANLVIVAPLWLLLAGLALRGSLRAYLLWLGVLMFTVYNYVIYTFSIPFGPLFLLWVAVLGMSLFSLIGGVTTLDHDAVMASFGTPRAITVVAWFLLVTAGLFLFLWLSEDLPALLSGTRPKSVVEMALPTNPVHIMDLAFFLPLVFATGVLLLKRRPLAYTLAVPLLVFLVLTGLPILITPVLQTARGELAGWGVVPPIGTLTVAGVAVLVWVLGTVKLPTAAGRSA